MEDEEEGGGKEEKKEKRRRKARRRRRRSSGREKEALLRRRPSLNAAIRSAVPTGRPLHQYSFMFTHAHCGSLAHSWMASGNSTKPQSQNCSVTGGEVVFLEIFVLLKGGGIPHILITKIG